MLSVLKVASLSAFVVILVFVWFTVTLVCLFIEFSAIPAAYIQTPVKYGTIGESRRCDWPIGSADN